MRDAVSVPVTVKHRIGIDRGEDYGFVRDFVGAVHAAGCEVFIVHARNAWLKGLSPRENREVPPLRYEVVHRLKRDFPHARFVLNGGLATLGRGLSLQRGTGRRHAGSRGVPRSLPAGRTSTRSSSATGPPASDARRRWSSGCRTTWCASAVAANAPRHIVRHMLGLYQGVRGARHWRRVLSDADAARVVRGRNPRPRAAGSGTAAGAAA